MLSWHLLFVCISVMYILCQEYRYNTTALFLVSHNTVVGTAALCEVPKTMSRVSGLGTRLLPDQFLLLKLLTLLLGNWFWCKLPPDQTISYGVAHNCCHPDKFLWLSKPDQATCKILLRAPRNPSARMQLGFPDEVPSIIRAEAAALMGMVKLFSSV